MDIVLKHFELASPRLKVFGSCCTLLAGMTLNSKKATQDLINKDGMILITTAIVEKSVMSDVNLIKLCFYENKINLQGYVS